MTKSRIALLVPPLLFAAPALAADPETFEQRMERQRTELRTAIGTAPCPTGKDADEIVVCARRGLDPHRLPLPSTRPGDRVAGELPSAVALTKEETCTNVGITRGCPSIDILGIGLMVGKVIVEQVAKKVAED